MMKDALSAAHQAEESHCCASASKTHENGVLERNKVLAEQNPSELPDSAPLENMAIVGEQCANKEQTRAKVKTYASEIFKVRI